jgi:transposase
MRRSRYRGIAKTHVQHVATGIACNIKRIVDWWDGVPIAATSASRFAHLMAT